MGNGEQVKVIQRELNILGLDAGAVDGIPGPRTTDAAVQFILDYGVSDIVNWPLRLEAEISELIPGELKTKEQLASEVRKLCSALDHSMPEHWAYIMATFEHETAGTFRPVEEAGYLSLSAQMRYLKSKPYFPFYGRGYIQRTWERNYRQGTEQFKGTPVEKLVDGKLDFIKYPNQLLVPQLSLLGSVLGMLQGHFRINRYLKRYINGSTVDFVWARSCVNGHRRGEPFPDAAEKIAKLADAWLEYYKGDE